MCWSSAWSYSLRALVPERVNSVGEAGVMELARAGEDAGIELAPCDAMDVAAVEDLVLTVPEFDDDDVSLRRLKPDNDGEYGFSFAGLGGSELTSSCASKSRALSLSFSCCLSFWKADKLTSSSYNTLPKFFDDELFEIL